MPRIRTIKPEFWSDEKLATVSEASLLVAIGLLNLADDEGYFNANPKLIDAFIFPLRESSMSTHGAISELSNIGYIEVFKCLKNEKDIGLVKNFLTHQVISRPTASKLAPIVDLTSSSLNTHGVITDNSLTERKGKEQGKEREGKGTCILSPKVEVNLFLADEIFQHWVKTMNKGSRTSLTALRKSKINSRLKAGYPSHEIKQAIDNVAKDSFLVAGGHTDIEMICRSDTNLEKYRDAAKMSNADIKMAKRQQSIEDFSNEGSYNE
jgi:hypothetical protein